MSRLDRKAARARCEAATPDAELTLIRYDHGGGRLYVEAAGAGRKLVADFYEEADREFYRASRSDLPAALDALDAADKEIARLREELQAIKEVAKERTRELGALRAPSVEVAHADYCDPVKYNECSCGAAEFGRPR